MLSMFSPFGFSHSLLLISFEGLCLKGINRVNVINCLLLSGVAPEPSGRLEGHGGIVTAGQEMPAACRPQNGLT